MGSTNFCTGGHQYETWIDFCRRTIDINEQPGAKGLGIAPFAIGTCPDCWSTRSYPIPVGGFEAAIGRAGVETTPIIWWDEYAGTYHYQDGDQTGVVCSPTSLSALCVLDSTGPLPDAVWDAALYALGDDWAWRSLVFTGQNQPRRLIRTAHLRKPGCYERPRVQKTEVVAELDRLEAHSMRGGL